MMTFQLMAILFIFLIAQTLRRVMKNSDALWQAQITASIIHLERWLPRYFWSRAGVSGLQLGLDNNWYIWVEDTIDSDAQSCSSPKRANVEEPQETRNKTEKKAIGNGTDPNSGVELRILRRRSRAHCSDTASNEVKDAECHL
ncbi:hypothetical protein chiPu_0019474 [Chiloscyllium punctatum]|uniref:Uncharacterized protein n=3 Tax=Chiloscyllium punctatum TaxID=137246 RepID=A0A401RRX8_CHIPU|nr:hypothetical protein [Chiloscyllium punctatum]